MTATLKEKIFMSFYACVLVVLFLMSSTNLIIKEKKREIYRVSVIVDDSKDEYYVNLKKGMDQAALEHNIDVNFITLYERNNSEQQRELLERELEGGSRAVILVPVDPSKTLTALENMILDVPLIILGNEEPSGNKVMANVSPDYYSAGQTMAQRVIKEMPGDAALFLFTEGLQYGSNRRLYDGLMSAFSQKGLNVNLIEKAYEDRYTEVMAERVAGEKKTVVVALDTQSLTEVAAIKELDEEAYKGTALYGPGTTLKILYEMEQGRINGVLAENQYNAGYLCMEKALEAIDSRNIKETVTLDSFFLDREDIAKREYEKMLYPIR